MNSKEKTIIEMNIEKMISTTIEGNCDFDRLGNITYKDKTAIIKRLQEILEEESSENNLDKNEVINCLIKFYYTRRETSKNPKESNEIIELLTIIKNTDKANEDTKKDGANDDPKRTQELR